MPLIHNNGKNVTELASEENLGPRGGGCNIMGQCASTASERPWAQVQVQPFLFAPFILYNGKNVIELAPEDNQGLQLYDKFLKITCLCCFVRALNLVHHTAHEKCSKFNENYMYHKMHYIYL